MNIIHLSNLKIFQKKAFSIRKIFKKEAIIYDDRNKIYNYLKKEELSNQIFAISKSYKSTYDVLKSLPKSFDSIISI